MKLSQHIDDNICIIKIEGDMTGVEARNYRFSSYIKKQLDNQPLKAIAFNMENVKFIDSFGIGVILLLHKLCKERQVDFALYQLNQEVMTTFSLTHINQIIPVLDTKEEALAHFVNN